jgi:hypothetical protein
LDAFGNFVAPIRDGVTLLGYGEVGVASPFSGYQIAYGRYFAIVPHERLIDIQFGDFRSSGPMSRLLKNREMAMSRSAFGALARKFSL